MAAYRCGLDIDWRRPTPAEVRSALAAVLAPLAEMGFDHGELSRLATLVTSGNARRVYGLRDAPRGRTVPTAPRWGGVDGARTIAG